ncbi:hypothetical protein [Limnoraphis robusta]|uniref:Uncharacterized protein n=1 Tax=Limnoraphis robusta CCNP1315 TaxID=3110306 RepID=A0ABU5TYV2_9CYAN|nr:hypothetical protein [Limnoraphis robusta]MEA5519831.1 hypothetical protein [Limnoraphis robusta CCNP1315]MEA5547866.1 hypothetical protein [Limnoraphis robusta CCNP1324]
MPPTYVTLFDAEYGSNEDINIDPVMNWDGTHNAWSGLTGEPYLYVPNDPFFVGDDALLDINEGVFHGVEYDLWGSPMVDFAGDPMFIDISPDFAPPPSSVPGYVTLFDAQYGTNEDINIDPLMNWDGTYNAWSGLTGEPYLYIPNDPFFAGDDALLDINEGAFHGVQYDLWGSPMVDFAGDPMFIDASPDFFV